MTALHLQFADEAAWYAPGIRWMSHASYNHVDLVMPDGRLLGARPIGGVRVRPADYQRHRSPPLIVEVPCDGDAAWAFAQAQVGKPYDSWAFFAFLAARDWQDPGAWICSELALEVLAAGRVFPHYPLCLPAHKATPGDLLLVLSALYPIA